MATSITNTTAWTIHWDCRQYITHIYRDSHNRLWVATVNGVCLYQANGNFKRVSINSANKNIEKILEDKEEESSSSR